MSEEFDVLNVISKLILAYTLSFALVFAPTLAFARPAVKSHKFKALPTSAYEAERAAAAAPKKSRAVNQAQRKIASVPSMPQPKVFKTQGEAIGSQYHKIHYKGQDVYISQVPTKDGKHVLSQTIRGPDFEEIMVDEFNTGTASTWSLKRGTVEMTASRPFKGAFSRLEVRERRAKSYLTTKLQLNPDFKTYRVVAYRIEPFRVDHDGAIHNIASKGEVVHGDKSQLQQTDYTTVSTSSLVYQCASEEQKNGIQQLQSLLNALAGQNQTPESALTCRLEAYQNALFDKSCLDPSAKPSFQSSTKDMADALGEIFSSIGTKPSRYLQCANDHHFAFYSAKMQSNFIHDYSNSEALMTPTKLRELSGAISSPDDCKPIEEGADASGTKKLIDMQPTEAGHYKPFRCDAKIAHDGEYHDDNSQQIVLGMNSADMVTAYRKQYGTNVSAKDAYASLFFHEMLHQAGIPEESQNVGENVVADMQDCCANPAKGSSSEQQACSRIDQRYKDQALRQASSTARDMYMSGNYMMESETQAMLGAAGADDFIGRWYSSLENDPKYANAKTAWETLQQCESAPDANRAACSQAAYPALQKFNDDWFKSNCGTYKSQGNLGNTLDCRDLRKKFDQYLASDLTPEQQKAQPGYTVTESMIKVDQDIPVSTIDSKITPITVAVINGDLRISNPSLQDLTPIKIPTLSSTTSNTGSKSRTQARNGQTQSTGNTARVGTATTQPQGQTTTRTNVAANGNNQELPSIGGTADQPTDNGNGTSNANNNGQTDNGENNGSSNASNNGQTDSGQSNGQSNSGQGTSYLGSSASSASVQKTLTSSKSMSSLLPSSTTVPSNSQAGRTAYGGTNNGTPITSAATSLVASAVQSATTAGTAGGVISDTLAGGVAKADPSLAASVRAGAGRSPASVSSSSGGVGGSGARRSSASLTGGSNDSPGSGEGQSQSQAAARNDQQDQQSQLTPSAQATATVDQVTEKVKESTSVGEKIVALSSLGEKGFKDQLALGAQSPVIGPLLAQKWTIIDTPMGKRLKPPGNGTTCYVPDRSRALRPVSCSKSR